MKIYTLIALAESVKLANYQIILSIVKIIKHKLISFILIINKLITLY